ncbi:MAG: AlpA family phage regulatory protein [Gammaproteobacteria bacterium]|nr:MAG: AlpA family phage regulatory protein [Gammaproteobacteria bacterium]
MRFLRIRHVMQLTGLSRMTIYRLELAGRFPKRRQLSKNSVAWLESDVEGWADSRPVARLRGTAAYSSTRTEPGRAAPHTVMRGIPLGVAPSRARPRPCAPQRVSPAPRLHPGKPSIAKKPKIVL